MSKTVKYVVAVVLKNKNNPDEFLVVRRPDDDPDLGGHWGFPAAGAVGAALATSLTSIVGALAMLGAVWTLPTAVEDGVRALSRAAWRGTWRGIIGLLRFGNGHSGAANGCNRYDEHTAGARLFRHCCIPRGFDAQCNASCTRQGAAWRFLCSGARALPGRPRGAPMVGAVAMLLQ